MATPALIRASLSPQGRRTGQAVTHRLTGCRQLCVPTPFLFLALSKRARSFFSRKPERSLNCFAPKPCRRQHRADALGGVPSRREERENAGRPVPCAAAGLRGPTPQWAPHTSLHPVHTLLSLKCLTRVHVHPSTQPAAAEHEHKPVPRTASFEKPTCYAKETPPRHGGDPSHSSISLKVPSLATLQ